jgi:hypothetical protein
MQTNGAFDTLAGYSRTPDIAKDAVFGVISIISI